MIMELSLGAGEGGGSSAHVILEQPLMSGQSVPQVEVNSLDIGTACLDVRDAALCYIVAAVQVYVLQLVEPGSNVFYRAVRNSGALPDIENMQIHQGFADLRDPLVRDLTSGQGQGSQVEQAAGDVDHGPVGDSLAEGDVQALQTHAALRQVAHPDITDVITRSQVQTFQRRYPC